MVIRSAASGLQDGGGDCGPDHGGGVAVVGDSGCRCT